MRHKILLIMFRKALETTLQGSKTRKLWQAKREKRIWEALTWDSGTEDNPRKHLVTSLANGLEVYFLKAGKEVFNKKSARPISARDPELVLVVSAA